MATRILAAWILDTRLLVVLLGDVLRARQLATFKYTTSIYLMGDGDCFPHPLGLSYAGDSRVEVLEGPPSPHASL